VTSEPSLSFDRAADFYDATRALPDDVSEVLTDAITAELDAAKANHLLELGVGTGRISRPLMQRGLRVTGIDISPLMMGRLLAQLTPSHTPPDLMLADATQMPFRDDSFPAMLFVHVLHLIPGWREAIGEMLRVLAPGGVILSSWDQTKGANWGEASAESDWDRAFEWWKEALNAAGVVRRKRANIPDISEAFVAAGATTDVSVIAECEETSTVAEELALMRDRIHSWSWEIPDETFYGLVPQHEAWAIDKFGSADAKLRRKVEYKLQVWRFDR
jgi:ubiquinone/menaquinone biosynthesis C-methylase UbiE